MAEFAYNNAKNISTGHIPFELNCDYHLKVSFKEDVDPCLRSRFANKLTEELRELIKILSKPSPYTGTVEESL